MKILIFYLSVLIHLTIQRHLLIKSINLRTSSNLLPIFNSSSLNKSSFFNTTKLTTKSIKTIPFYLIKKPIKKFKKLTNSDSKSRILVSSSNKIEHFIQPNNVNNLDKDNNVIIIDDHNLHTIDNDVVKKIDIDEQLTPTLISDEDDEKLIAKRFDDINLMRKLGGLASITSLLSTSQRRISPLNKIILGLLGPKLIKLQLDMAFGAIISELIRKLLMPVLGFVVDKSLPASMQPNQVPYSSNQLEQLQNAYANLQTSIQSNTQSTTQSPISNQQLTNYANHPSYSTGYQTTSSAAQPANNLNTNPYVYYGQAQLANYLSSQSQQQLAKSSQEQSVQSTAAPASTHNLNQLTTQQLSQQLNQLINQYTNSINQHASQQQTNQQQSPQTSDQNNQLYQQLQNLILEQVKLKNQLEQLAKPRNYFAKEMDTETKEDYQNEDDLKDASLNQIEQEYDRAQRWNTVLKNMDHYNETLSIK